MNTVLKRIILAISAMALGATVFAQKDFNEDANFVGPSFNFNCPERNGLFADSEQCDLYYVCKNGVSEASLCPDGHLFDDRIRNHEKCVLPHNVDCGKREFVQEPQAGIDKACERANGLFDHEDPAICNRFFTCDKGKAHEIVCAFPLVFDSVIGACVRKENISPGAKNCDSAGLGVDGNILLKTVDGFTCPNKEVIGPNGLVQAHPTFPHPDNCQFFFSCLFGKDPNKLGCPTGQVFDPYDQICKDPVQVSECKCWYSCGEDSECPGSCRKDCSCPT